ncbi:hypothetical protein [Desulforamulus ruminis]|uniref:Uncharacterized protein n=1 Tax=Desulforamulus ruminis (strain ATCC 23193 / DSM 2154 / NCIMB 8452 / DL) TaxID=696281 RepID=F6DRY3_DESRL|nr:hypothetical protein [Desulforamulus ruminis]AEG61007.1 hypothetical protein Desru_2793 [Desulforamulus ruminis DSM 2154]
MENQKTCSGYRVNQRNDGSLIGIEVICCGKHLGEVRYKDGEVISCPVCRVKHKVKIHHNHFHLERDEAKE